MLIRYALPCCVELQAQKLKPKYKMQKSDFHHSPRHAGPAPHDHPPKTPHRIPIPFPLSDNHRQFNFPIPHPIPPLRQVLLVPYSALYFLRTNTQYRSASSHTKSRKFSLAFSPPNQPSPIQIFFQFFFPHLPHRTTNYVALLCPAQPSPAQNPKPGPLWTPAGPIAGVQDSTEDHTRQPHCLELENVTDNSTSATPRLAREPNLFATGVPSCQGRVPKLSKPHERTKVVFITVTFVFLGQATPFARPPPARRSPQNKLPIPNPPNFDPQKPNSIAFPINFVSYKSNRTRPSFSHAWGAPKYPNTPSIY